MALAMFLCSSLNASNLFIQNCQQYAQEAATAELIYLFGDDAPDVGDAMMANTIGFWEGNCEGQGGNALMPVFLEQ